MIRLCFLAPLVGAAALLLSASGCEAEAKFVPVQGKITVGDAPLPHGTVVFSPNAEEGNTSLLEPRGTVNADGSYSLTTLDKEGAPVGAYRVAVFAISPTTPEGSYEPPVWAADQKYSQAKSSGLTANVQEGAPAGAYDFKLTK